MLAADYEQRRFAVRCLVEGIENPWAFQRLLDVITEEESKQVRLDPAKSESVWHLLDNRILEEASRPFRLIDWRLTKLPVQLMARVEGLSRMARWAATQALSLIAMSGYHHQDRDLLIDALLQRLDDPSVEVRYLATDGLGDFAYHEHYRSHAEVPHRVIEALERVASSRDWPAYQTALEALLRIGQIEIDAEWMAREAKALVDQAEKALVTGDSRMGASMAANYFDEVVGPAYMEAVEQLGPAKFEQLLLLALPAAPSWSKNDVIWQLSRIGSDASVPALIAQVRAKPLDDDLMGCRIRLAAANALACIGTDAAVSALLEFLRDEEWEVRLLGAMALMRLRSAGHSAAEATKLADIVRGCWSTAKGHMLEFLSAIRGGILYWREGADPKEDFTIDPIIGNVLKQLPRNEVRLAAREMLAEDRQADFACRVLGDIGTAEDLPFLHTKLQNVGLHEAARQAMERIQQRM